MVKYTTLNALFLKDEEKTCEKIYLMQYTSSIPVSIQFSLHNTNYTFIAIDKHLLFHDILSDTLRTNNKQYFVGTLPNLSRYSCKNKKPDPRDNILSIAVYFSGF